jgi:hypothetical protein
MTEIKTMRCKTEPVMGKNEFEIMSIELFLNKLFDKFDVNKDGRLTWF